MSHTQQPPWLACHYEKLILVVALLALGSSACSIVYALRARTREKQVLLQHWSRPQKLAKEISEVELAERFSNHHVPYERKPNPHRLFVSELRVRCTNVACAKPIEYYAVLCPFCSAVQPEIVAKEERDSDGDGMVDLYEERYHLDPLDPTDAFIDNDGDGFSNVEEFGANTDPSKEEEFPSLSAKLRLIRSVDQPFIMRFQGVQQLPDGKRFLLNLHTLERSYFVKLGEEVEGYKIVRFDLDGEDGPTLTVKKGSTALRLVKGKRIDSFEVAAHLVFLLDRKEFMKKVGEVFKIRDQSYRIIDIQPDHVVVQDLDSDVSVHIGLLSEADKRELFEEAVETMNTSILSPTFIHSTVTGMRLTSRALTDATLPQPHTRIAFLVPFLEEAV